jgi:ketosteroid isomerase-like protein
MFVRSALASAALACLAVPSIAPAETIAIGPRHGDLLAIADMFDKAQLTQDRVTLERMVDDGLIFIQSSGKRAGKKAFIDGWTTPGDSYDPVMLVDRVVVDLGPDAFMVSAATTLSGNSGGKRFSSSIRFTDTFRRISGEWRAIHIQVTPTAG